jgi:phasin family protein
MTSLPEQLTAVRTSPFEAQLHFFCNLTAQVFERAEQVLALNINTSLASVEKSSAAVQQLIAARDPRDLLALGAQTQDSIQSMLAYSRALFSIASGARAGSAIPAVVAPAARGVAEPAPAPVPAVPAVTALAVVPVPAAPAAELAVPAAELAAPAAELAEASPSRPAFRDVKPSKKPVVARKPARTPARVAKATAIASAASAVAARPASAPKPLASPFPTSANHPVAIPPIKPVEAAPPPAPVAGTPALDQKPADTLGKANRKK